MSNLLIGASISKSVANLVDIGEAYGHQNQETKWLAAV
jgi:hypothetical protein